MIYLIEIKTFIIQWCFVEVINYMKKDFRKIKTNSGAAMLISIVFFLFISLSIISGLVSPSIREFKNANVNLNSKKSFFLAESGTEDAFYRIIKSKPIDISEIITLDSNTATTTISIVLGNKIISSLGDVGSLQRKTKITLVVGMGTSFNYGVQSGQGGFVLENSASVTGNVYSSGAVTGAGNTIYGDVISTGLSGLVNGIHATGSVYAHNIRETSSSNQTIIDKNAYYVNKDAGVTVIGVSYPGSPDQPPIEMPISDEQIEELKAGALAGGTAICSGGEYKITASTSLGPIKIPCDLNISNDPTIILNGNIWVTGDITIQNTAIIRISSGLGDQSLAIIADNPTNRTSSSKIHLKNSAQFFGSGSAGSFVFLISQNNSAELGGGESAISMDNSADGKAVILYASHGMIDVQNSAVLKEITGYKIKAKNSANIIYDSGLANTLFTSGPGGGYEIIGWKEVE